MSSGALLLKQLQGRQKEQAAAQAQIYGREKSNGVDADTPSRAGKEEGPSAQSAGSTCSTGEVLNSRHVEQGMNRDDKSVTIEVCLGPDCSGGGGGAALLEIEALVMGSSGGEASTLSSGICVVGGGCRDYCTMGPNVHIHTDFVTAEDSHFTKVNCPAECRRVVRKATDGKVDDTPPVGDDSGTADVGTILQLREDGRRWQRLREQAAKERRLRARERDPNRDTGRGAAANNPELKV